MRKISESGRFPALLLVVITTLLVAGCAADDPYRRAKTGAAIGAVAGAILGHQVDGDDGRYVGAAAGAALGAGVGYTLDRQHQELERLAAENERLGLEVSRLEDGAIKLDIPSEVTFDFDSAEVRPAFRSALDDISAILRQDSASTITVVGHTDSVGDAGYNLDLSQRRANSVARYFEARGVPPRRLYTDGVGEAQPRADNGSEYGRSQNRRVEVFIREART